jgi:cardiolipin synthase
MVLNIPNSMSIMRIVMAPILFVLILNITSEIYPILIILYFFTVLLDFFDGYVARKLSQETEMGKILDPLADKLLMFSLVLAFIIEANFPVWLAVIIILRDFALLLGSFVIFKKKYTVRASILIGKATFSFLSFLILIYVIDLNPAINLEILKRFFIPLTFSYILWSVFEYNKIYNQIKNGS